MTANVTSLFFDFGSQATDHHCGIGRGRRGARDTAGCCVWVLSVSPALWAPAPALTDLFSLLLCGAFWQPCLPLLHSNPQQPMHHPAMPHSLSAPQL